MTDLVFANESFRDGFEGAALLLQPLGVEGEPLRFDLSEDVLLIRAKVLNSCHGHAGEDTGDSYENRATKLRMTEWPFEDVDLRLEFFDLQCEFPILKRGLVRSGRLSHDTSDSQVGIVSA